ncbi:DUF11 domain-containing protein [Myroides sp. WP-1]|uniref:DUF7507 domain-containing protein n=1 Tax=Myroides sp. WP-1 TaxID=2759944 RepID=UPI0015F8F9B6|nr:DUF11 domain-containing protein [Myroides sp. WP-1]MBB1139863.1 hypothetical protein [Myroides sp. WP-1]
MRSKKYKIVNSIQKVILAVFVLLLGIGNAWAEGSKDLYPVGAKGGRAYLRASTEETFAFPYSGLGVHYVYAEEGEQITLASDAQMGTDKKWITLFAPNGEQVNLTFNYNEGKIPSRTAELAGPRLPEQKAGESRYIPIYYTVPKGGSGVYRVEFLGSYGKPSGAISTPRYSEATAWPLALSTNYLIAWDVSVAKKINNTWNWVTGRTFTTVMSMNNPSIERNLFMPNSGFHGVFKILTKDGYIYNVDNNGNQGISFTFMVNNQGFYNVGDPTTPSYSSIPIQTTEDTHTRYHDPRIADTENAITQKIFYNIPDSSMPEEAVAAMDGGKTWLRTPEKQLHVKDIRVESAEGSIENQGGNGAYIVFNNESGGEYTLTIQPKQGSHFTSRILKGFCASGENKIYWDGRDGDGQIIVEGSVDLRLAIELHGAEVHFPYIDMELNEYGIIIELLSLDRRSVRSDKVYWDDTSIGDGGGNAGSKSQPRNASHLVLPEGISSRVNGHTWGIGTNATVGTFGDNHGMDTWTFIKGDAVTADFDVKIKVADLEVVSVQADKEVVPINDVISYTVKVKNNGPHEVEKAVFAFQIPQGFSPVGYDFIVSTCGEERVPLTFDEATRKYTSQLDLKNQCEVVYTIRIKAVNPTVGPVAVEATILRPVDVVDPDASNQDENVPPTDPHYECENNGLDVPCNNIKENTDVLYTEVSFKLLKDGRFNDLNNDGFAQAGETITYTLQVVNTGKTPIEEIQVIDPLFGGIITEIPTKNGNSDAILEAEEIWTYTVTYTLTKQDIANKGVYNQATVKGKDIFNKEVLEETSSPTVPLKPNDPGYDANRPNHTYVVLPTKSLLITNPMVRQRMK